MRIDIDEYEVLDQMATKEIEEYLSNRTTISQFTLNEREAADVLNHCSDIFRREGRNDLALKLEIIRTDFIIG